jgi:GT2 family glycosyltransferase
VIIPASAKPELLGACLRSLSRFGPDRIPYETIVVLNQASRNLETELRQRVKGTEIVASPVNLGLAGAGNRGRSLARGEFLVILHDDAEIEPGWMEALVDTAELHPEAGAVGGKVLSRDGRLQSAGLILRPNGDVSGPWHGEVPAPTAFDRLRPVDFCGTSSLLVRAMAWDAVGGLDERFYPVYYVDIDLSMALRRLGMIVLYQPHSRIRHHKGASTSARFGNFVFNRNKLLFIEKWGTALEEHESLEGDTPVTAALTRAKAFALKCQERQIPTTPTPAGSIPFDSVLQERRHIEKSRALKSAYVAHVIFDEVKLATVKRGWRWLSRIPSVMKEKAQYRRT